jgi:hypothetical protein
MKHDMEEFRVATCMFWLSFFVNQCGCDIVLRPALLQQLTSASKSPFYKSDSDYKNEFKRIHNLVMDLYTTATERFMNEWTSSPAGEAYLEAIA